MHIQKYSTYFLIFRQSANLPKWHASQPWNRAGGGFVSTTNSLPKLLQPFLLTFIWNICIIWISINRWWIHVNKKLKPYFCILYFCIFHPCTPAGGGFVSTTNSLPKLRLHRRSSGAHWGWGPWLRYSQIKIVILSMIWSWWSTRVLRCRFPRFGKLKSV